MYVYIYIYIYTRFSLSLSISLSLYTYIYIYRERERDLLCFACLTACRLPAGLPACRPARLSRQGRSAPVACLVNTSLTIDVNHI